MSDVVIRAEGLGKKYLIGHQSAGRERYTALRDVIGRQVKSFARSARDMVQGRQIVAGEEIEEFWALKDVSFEIRRGEVVGIIGRNGAGKSTLLKVLSRITEPSAGRVEIKGRVASLLEVGTGFHPELSGRENIYLNGAILGMSRAEIRRKFDEIVAFAEVEKFLDTPVKRYSSGMYVRLAFAVAAHLEPEILVVDEVLAVGDAEFQKKCLGKMQDVAGHGRTVLFVSHNLAAVRQLCDKVLVISRGRLEFEGEVEAGLLQYLSSGRCNAMGHWLRSNRATKKNVSFSEISISLIPGQSGYILHCDMHIEVIQRSQPCFAAFDIRNAYGPIMQAIPTLAGFVGSDEGIFRVSVEIQLPPLVPGHYIVDFWLGPHNTETYDLISGPVQFEINDSPTAGRVFPHTPDHGAIVPVSYLKHATRVEKAYS